MFNYGKIFILVILAMALCAGCGNKEEGIPEKEAGVSTRTQSPPEEEPVEYETGEEEYTEGDETGEPQDGDDLGEPCENHVYVIAAGSNVSLDFQVILKREVIQMDAYAKDRFDPEDVSLQDGTDHWIKHGIGRGEASWDLETVDTSIDLWGVRADDLIEKQAAQGGKLISISQSHRGRDRYKIRISEEGYGFFTRLGNWSGELNIAQMSEDDVYAALGEKMEVEHIDVKTGNTILPVELIPVDAESYVLNISYNITFPDDVRTDLRGASLFQSVKIGNLNDAGFKISIHYNKKKKMFRVIGPWEDSSCL